MRSPYPTAGSRPGLPPPSPAARNARSSSLGTSGQGEPSHAIPDIDEAVLEEVVRELDARYRADLKVAREVGTVLQVGAAMRRIAELEFYMLGLNRFLPAAWEDEYIRARDDMDRAESRRRLYEELKAEFEG